MKGILFDENIPKPISLTTKFPIFHANDLGASAPDSKIWEYARKESLVIVSKDADFSNRIMISSAPPWIVHLRFGNMRRTEFHAFLSRVWPQVEATLPEHKLVNVYSDRIEAVKN